MWFMRESKQIALKVGACISVIFTPSVAVDAAVLFNKLSTIRAVFSLAFALAMFGAYHLAQRTKPAVWHYGVAIMLLVVQGSAYVRFFVGDPRANAGYAVIALAGSAAMVLHRIWVSKKGWFDVLMGVDVMRLSAVLALLLVLHVVGGGEVYGTVGLLVLLFMIALPVLMYFVEPDRILGEKDGGRGFLGTWRWITPFGVSGNLFIYVKMNMQGPGLIAAILLAFLYAVLRFYESSEKKLQSGEWFKEMPGVSGSMVAGVLLFLLKNGIAYNPMVEVFGGVGLIVAALTTTYMYRQQ
jgi:hypothetical protein